MTPKIYFNSSDNNSNSGDRLMLKLFLDTLIKFAQESPNLLTPYTQKMANEMNELLTGVTVDEDG
jgi:antitoxin PrlF